MRATGIESITTGGAIVEASAARLAIKKLVLISPYVQSNNDSEIAYLHKAGFSVLPTLRSGFKGSVDYIAVPPEHWVRDCARQCPHRCGRLSAVLHEHHPDRGE